jgi:hypothetical protein
VPLHYNRNQLSSRPPHHRASIAKPTAMADNQPTKSPSSNNFLPLTTLSNISTGRSPPNKTDWASQRPPPSPQMNHRPSMAENLRANPTSPRQAHRSPSFSQQALQDLLNNPPTARTKNEVALNDTFAGRDWRSIQVAEIVDRELVRFVEMDTSVEEATNVISLIVNE